MTILEFSAFVGLGSLAAGFLGSLTGLGGGVVIVPLLTLVFGVDIRYAIGGIPHLGNRNLLGGCCRVRQGRILKHTNRDVP